MKKLGTYTDITIDERYDLYDTTLFELRELMKDRYAKLGVTDFNQFNYESDFGKYPDRVTTNARAANMYLLNNFFVTQGLDSDDTLLVDGFNRLFMLDAAEDQQVFVKNYDRDLPVRKVIWMLYQLNYWKKSRDRMSYMYDRGFALYTFIKTGINIAQEARNGVANMFNLVARYTAAEIWQDYDSYDPNTYSQNGQIMFENDKFFDDIKLIHDLHNITVTVDNKYKPEQEMPASFFAIVASLRTLQLNNKIPDWFIDVDDVAKFLKTDTEAVKLYKVYFTKQLSNGRSAARKALTDYLMSKYIKPVVLKEDAVATKAERKKELSKKIAKRNKSYTKLYDPDSLSIGHKYYRLGDNGTDPVEIEFEYLGSKSVDGESRMDGSKYTYTKHLFKSTPDKEEAYTVGQIRSGTFYTKK